MEFDSGLGDVPTRPMRVKVLYTFDIDNKTNCLARLQEILEVPALPIDENTQVGVVELEQCIQAVLAASPELLSRLSDGDFTIYAFDYSEEDTPLVGQGMLSSLISSNSRSPRQCKAMITGRVCKNMFAAFSNGVKETLEVKLRLVPVPSQTNRRLLQRTESTASLGSTAMTSGFDPNEWTQPQQQRRDDCGMFNFQADDVSHQERDRTFIDDVFGFAQQQDHHGLGGANGQLSGQEEGGVLETLTDTTFQLNPAFTASYSHSAPGSRAGSPMVAPETVASNFGLRHQSFSVGVAAPGFADHSRPASRMSVRSEHPPSHHQRQRSSPAIQTTQAQQYAEVSYDEDGQPRKRAKVMQADWRGKSSFGKKGDLRVTAATASSVHMHRPIAQRPNAAPGSNLEPPPRVPTPVPRFGRSLAQQRPTGGRTLLRQASTASMMGSDFMSDVESPGMSEGGMMSSPEDERSPSDIGQLTPQDIPSSPPVFPEMLPQQPQPSSPGLPSLPPPRMADSGYMSERGFQSANAYDCLDEDENRSPGARNYAAVKPYSRAESHPVMKTEHVTPSGRSEKHGASDQKHFLMQAPGDMSQLPNRMLLNLPPGRRREQSLGSNTPLVSASSLNHHKTLQNQSASVLMSEPDSVRDDPQSRRNSLALPPKPTPSSILSIPPAPKGRTYSTADSNIGSPAPSDNEGQFGRPKGPSRSGSGAQRRKVIEQRLAHALASGEVPSFCHHCGSLETPTWRRMYTKTCTGKPSPLDSLEGEGETVGIEETEWNDDSGECTKFVIRKTIKKAREKDGVGYGFEEVQVCNPCGLWFNKARAMRPSHRWGRRSGTRKNKKPSKSSDKDLGNGGVSTDAIEPPSEAFLAPSEAFLIDGVILEEGESFSSSDNKNDSDEAMSRSRDGVSSQSRQPGPRPRSSSMHGENSASCHRTDDNCQHGDFALGPAAQSSPVRFNGSKDSPIEVEDLTPKPTRRQLFPSPRKDGEFKSLGNSLSLSSKRKSPASRSLSSPTKRHAPCHSGGADVFDVFVNAAERENVPPGTDRDDELAHLFEASPEDVFKTPAKQRTPTKTGSGSGRSPRSQELELLETPTPASRRQRKPLTPNINSANSANNHESTAVNASNDWLTSPSSSRYFLRSTPTRLGQTTPGGRLNQVDSQRGSRRRNTGAFGSDASDGIHSTPFSKHISQLLERDTNLDSNKFSSPSRMFDFGNDFPSFTTPGREIRGLDWDAVEGILSSEFGNFDESEQTGDVAK
ncbi:hypothetical protein K431DRAFT_242424 [Polychaeton citri CBS 116435]|uniref:Ams2/SPT21 N-terminal domain-containing protein n=1 Tax=Polychaeton citri CBS 116435 TaxID=1314669 RepID=A0A9P4QET8_9PEZI|nr:hypothetical protein K431DRAFT_242424 [Polychaeton citri CBS 116435]